MKTDYKMANYRSLPLSITWHQISDSSVRLSLDRWILLIAIVSLRRLPIKSVYLSTTSFNIVVS